MNRFVPSASDVSTTTQAPRKKVALLVVGASAIQLLWLMLWMEGYWELFKTGAVSVATVLGSFAGCVLLYVGVGRFVTDAMRGNRLFIASFVCLVLSVSGWDLRYPWGYAYVYAAVIAATGWWFSRGRVASQRMES